jgi:chromosome segregation ATPase
MISDDEREEILKEIERSVHVGRAKLEAAKGSGVSGALLPFAVNAGALLLVALAVLFVPGFYDIDERRLVSDGGPNSVGASELFRALRREADEQIQEREETIESLQYQFLQVRSERESLQKDFEQRLSARAGELESQLRAALDSERQRLSASGVADAAADARLRELETRLQAERQGELAAFSARLQAETAEKDRSLAEAQARYDDELKRRTDPLMAEIDRLTAQGSAQAAERQGLAARYDSLLRELEKAQADRSAETAALRKDLQDTKALAERLQAQESARKVQVERLNALLRRYAASPAPSPSASAQAGMLELLQAKVDTRALLATEPVKASNPGLAERLDRYFEDYEDEYRSQGRAAALKEAGEIIDSLIARRDPRNLSAGDAELRRFMEKLQALIK